MDTKVLRNLSYGVYVVTTENKDTYAGCIANSVIQVTSDPKTILVSINKDNYTNSCIKVCKKFAISILSETVDPTTIGIFGFQSSRDVDKFKTVSFTVTRGVPIINNCCGYIICDVIDTVETSTHTLFIGEIKEMDGYQKENPMTYRYYHEVLKGTSPQNAPTYIEESQPQKNDNAQKKYKCKVCGYVYEGENLPKDFICPICGQPHTEFIEIN